MNKTIAKNTKAGNVRRTVTLNKKNAKRLNVLATITGLDADELVNTFYLNYDLKDEARELILQCIDYPTVKSKAAAIERLRAFEGEEEFEKFNAAEKLNNAIDAKPLDIATIIEIGRQFPELMGCRAIALTRGTALVMTKGRFEVVNMLPLKTDLPTA